MGWNDHLLDGIENTRTCPYCKEIYNCIMEPQELGNKFPETETCPYCGQAIRESMSFSFITYKRQ